MGSEETGVGSKTTYVKGLKSRLLIDLIRLVGTSPSGIGYTIERAEVVAKDNKYQLIDSFTKMLQNAPTFGRRASLCVDFTVFIP